MGRGKPFRSDKEQSRVRELSHKNKELQKEVARLRRENERLRNQWIESGEPPVAIEEAPAPKKKERICYDCGKGRLIMIKYMGHDGEWYFRSCDLCSYRTRSKRLTSEVEE